MRMFFVRGSLAAGLVLAGHTLLPSATASAMAASPSRETLASFTDILAGLPPVSMSSVAWGDYDNDGDLDILLTGYSSSGPISRIYANNGGTFTDVGAGLPGVYKSSVAWGDFDNDGDLDILLTGSYISRVYANQEGVFTDIHAGLPGVNESSATWGDYDNDGDLDILLTGWISGGPISRIYRNHGGLFTDIAAGLSAVYQSSVAWGDYDNDGDLDILLTGNTGGGYVSRIYANSAGVFTDINAGLLGVTYSSVAWGDYDNDGDLDVLQAGWSGSSYDSRIYANSNGTFADIAAGLQGVELASVAWGDYDNDGDMDVLLTGYGNSGQVSCIYANSGGAFTDIAAGLPGVSFSSAAWGDYDNDGDLDALLTGITVPGNVRLSSIYANNVAAHNTAPAAPAGLSASLADSTLRLTWGSATDAQTPASGLTYNLRVGITPGGAEIAAAMSAASSGYRRIVRVGSANHNRSWTLTSARISTVDSIYWTVQAIDTGFMGSAFAAEQRIARIPIDVDATPPSPCFALHPNVPNPFNPRTTLTYDLPANARVHLAIYDAEGRLVRGLAAGSQLAGRHTAQWDGKNDAGVRVASGVYVCRLQAGKWTAMRRLTLLK